MFADVANAHAWLEAAQALAMRALVAPCPAHVPHLAPIVTLSARVTLATAPRASARPIRRALTPRASADSAQLGTAKLPPTVDEAVFVRSMFQWANGLTTSGQNLPFALPQRVDALETGFSMAFLQSDPNGEPGTFVSVGEIVASVEDVDGDARALIVRGTGKAAEKGVLVDVPMVMNTMVPAIKNAIAMSSQ